MKNNFQLFEIFGIFIIRVENNLTYNSKIIFESEDDKQKILKMLESQRFAWNECSKVRLEKGTKNSIIELHGLFYQEFRKSNPEVPSQVVISAEQSVLSAFRSIKSNKHRIKSAPIKNKLSIRLDKRTYSFKNGVFSIISLEKRVKCKPYVFAKLESLIKEYPMCDPLIFERDGDVWMAMTFKLPEKPKTEILACGVDLGCVNLAATNEGNLYKDKRYNSRKRKIRFNKRKLQSKNTKSSLRKLKKIRYKERNISKNLTHHLANKILKDTSADVLVLEDLTGIKKKKHKYQNKNRISQIPMFMLKEILTYKAHLLGKQVKTVNPAYTSQIDHRTGLKDGKRSAGRYIGKDGKILNADINASCNIAIRSKLPCSIRNYYAGQAVVNQPIVGS